MKNKTKVCFAILILLIFISTNIYAQDNTKRLSLDVSERIRNNRIFDSLSKEEIETQFNKYLYNFENFNDEISNDLINYKGGFKFLPIMSIEKAIKDVDFLFKLLKYGYAGYQFFGGDEKFLYAKSKIVFDIQQRDNIFSVITTSTFKNILYKNLNFIQDGHFSIENMQLCKDYNFFTTEKYIFLKDEIGFYTIIDGYKGYLVAVNGENPNNYIKLSLNQEGQIVYRLGMLSQEQREEFNLCISLKSENEDRLSNKKAILLKQNYKDINQNSLNKEKNPYNRYKLSGISVIEHRTTAPTPKNIEKLEKFVEEAKEFRNDKIVILDIRGNYGGSETYPHDWVKNYTGENIEYGNISCSLATNTALKMLINNVEKLYKDPKLISEVKSMFKVNKTGWSEIEYSKIKKINNKNLIVVLMDSHVASGGESFVRLLRQFDNVIFIGSRTSGVKTFGNVGVCKLPYSKLEINFGMSLFFEPDLKFIEGMGYFPDFWVNPENSLDAALKFISNYLK